MAASNNSGYVSGSCALGAVVGVTVPETIVDIAVVARPVVANPVVDGATVVLTAVDETGNDTVLVEAGANPSSELEQAARKMMTANVTPTARRLIILASLKDPKRSAHSDVRTLAIRLS